MYSIKQVAAPVNLPLELAEVKLYLREDGDVQDDVITGLIKAAVAKVERVYGIALMPQTYDLGIDTFPVNGVIRVPMPPLQKVTGITYLDYATGERPTVDPSVYLVDVLSSPGRIYPAYGKYWPYPLYAPYTPSAIYGGARPYRRHPWPDSVIVRFTCGYSEAASPEDATAEQAAVPDDIKLGLKMLIAHWYENRSAVETGTRAQAIDVPITADELLVPYRMFGPYP